MSDQTFRDSNYERICPYCIELFQSNHANRRFCKGKNGQADYCKIRFDGQIKKLQQRGEGNNRFAKPNARENYQRMFNIQVLSNLYNADFFFLDEDDFDKLNYDMNIFDKQRRLGNSSLYVVDIGRFQLQWAEDKIITITKKQQL